MKKHFDCIVVGAGHAGIEASLACARMGLDTLLICFKLDAIGLMSCNPAIGGVGKGQLVKEVDALGGAMGKAADKCAIGYRMLNMSKGPAVRSSRCQIDRQIYREYMINLTRNTAGLTIKEAEVTEIITRQKKAKGVRLSSGEKIFSKAVVIASGTFLNALMHIGLKSFRGGRWQEPAAISLSKNLKEYGFRIKRFKTGTCARLKAESIDFSKLKKQLPDKEPIPFSFGAKVNRLKQLPCFITYTNAQTHRIVNESLKFSPLYTGKIKASGVRYCPSIEDKVVKFPHHLRHQIFLEPEGLESEEFYPNGLSTSLPEDVQIRMFRSIKGLEKAEISRPGYGIEHEIVCPTQLFPTLETKLIENLFLVGQINGTTGYEEAAALGLIGGINAALKVRQRPEFILERTTSYIGVLIDDLVTKGTDEPYRMFTSRAEYRLMLREDNADLRLRKLGFDLGLVEKKDYEATREKKRQIDKELIRLKKVKLKPSAQINKLLKSLNSAGLKNSISLEELLKRPEINYNHLKILDSAVRLNLNLAQNIDSEIKYAPFIKRQKEEVEKFKNLDKIKIPRDCDFSNISSLSREVKEKLGLLQPLTLGQASRISGITPASISVLMIWLRKRLESSNS